MPTGGELLVNISCVSSQVDGHLPPLLPFDVDFHVSLTNCL